MASSGKGNKLFLSLIRKCGGWQPETFVCWLVGWSVNIELVVVGGGGVVKFPRAGRDSN